MLVLISFFIITLVYTNNKKIYDGDDDDDDKGKSQCFKCLIHWSSVFAKKRFYQF